MNPLKFSSGDLLADRRADYAEMLFSAGDADAAADLMGDALELAPQWAAGHFRLGEMREAAGRQAEAVEAWRTALRLDPADRLGAMLKLEIAGAAMIGAVPSGFVETLFDQYAADFDHALLERLEYRVPQLLADAIAATGRAGFAHCLDLGCGTGLMGERLRRSASFVEGLDISAEMLKRAAAKGVYDRLDKADLQTIGQLPAGADIVTAADVFMYVGALERIAGLVARALPATGLFAFSVERNDGRQEMTLGQSRRYAHSEAYVRSALAGAGFAVLSLEASTIRMDRGTPVEGLVIVAERLASPARVVLMQDEPAGVTAVRAH